MGRFVTAYVLDLDRLHSAIGSGDEELQHSVEAHCADEIARDHEYFESYPRPILSLTDALRALFAGGPFDTEYSYRYNTAYELVCKALSVWSNSHGPYRSDDWLAEVDDGFRSMGISSIGFAAFEEPYLPSGLPYMEYGGYGEWDHDSCAEASESRTAEAIERYEELNDEVREWIAVGLDIADEAASWAGYGVAGFFNI
ncbi:hypothetical protein [Nocardia sp. NPDC051832]|uniref:DUF7691 family protein n=1 Tax=Nocardia sp. NPDC051832 TaxID=3155673 RepID=UPI00343C5906